MRRVLVFAHLSRMTVIALSVVQFLLGAACICLQGYGIAIDLPSTHLGSTGIWAGALILLTAISGAMAGAMKTPGTVLSFLVLNVLSAMAAVAIVATSALSLMTLMDLCNRRAAAAICSDPGFTMRRALDLSLIVLALIEYCVASSALIICCWTLYCDPAGYLANEEKVKNWDNSSVEMDEPTRVETLPDEEEPPDKMRRGSSEMGQYNRAFTSDMPDQIEMSINTDSG